MDVYMKNGSNKQIKKLNENTQLRFSKLQEISEYKKE